MHAEDSIDPMGWAAHHLRHVRGLGWSNGYPPPIDVLARFIDILSSEVIPDEVAFIHTAGVLTGLNKVDEATRLARAHDGLPPKVRPINSPSMMNGIGGKALSQTKVLTDLKESTTNQNGLVTNGTSKTSHQCLKAYHTRKVLHIEDGKNAFNNFGRKLITTAIAKRAPGFLQYVNTYYGKRACSFYLCWEGDIRYLKVIWSEQGTRMGEHFASLLYDVSLEEAFLKGLMKGFPEITHILLTDDNIRISDCPASDDLDGWETWYTKRAEYLAEFDRVATPGGFERVPEKSFILIPPDAPEPISALRANGIFLNVTRKGIVIAGTPIGTSEFMKKHAQLKLDQTAVKVARLRKFGKVNPQQAMRILSDCLNHTLDYYVRVTPPDEVKGMIASFDLMIITAAFDILEPPEARSTFCPAQRKLIASEFMRLSWKKGGFNLCRLQHTSPSMYLSSLQSLTHYSFTENCLPSFNKYTKQAYECLYSLFQIPQIEPSHPLSNIIATKPDDFLKIPRNPRKPILGAISALLEKSKIAALKDDFVRDDSLLVPPKIHELTATHYLDNLTRSMSTRAISGDLSDPQTRIIPAAFWAYFRWYLNLPPTTTEILVQHPDYDYPVTYCQATLCKQSHEGKVVDAQGNHAVACQGSKYGPTCNTHTNLKTVVIQAAKDVGLQARDEPSTASILNGQFTPEQIRGMFPKSKTKASQKISEELHKLLLTIESMPPSPARMALSDKASQIQRKLPDATHEQHTGLRIDVAIDGGSQPVWVDVTSLHSTCDTYVKSQYQWHLAEHQAGIIADFKKSGTSFSKVPSASVAVKIKEKNTKYLPLIRLAQLQHVRHRRASLPRFQACVLSHHCEFSPGFFELFDWFTGQFRRQQHAIFNYEGIPLSTRVAGFQTQLYNRGVASMVAGWGMHLTMMGQQCF
jgi:hypothetical protein